MTHLLIITTATFIASCLTLFAVLRLLKANKGDDQSNDDDRHPDIEDLLALDEGQKNKNKPWNKSEVAYLLENFRKRKDGCARSLGRSVTACSMKYYDVLRKNRGKK